MRNRVAQVALMGIAVAVIGLLGRQRQDVTGAEGSLKIGVIDLNRVVAECQMGKDRVKELDESYNAKRAELEKERESITKLAEELKLLDATSEEASEKRRDFAQKAALLKAQADISSSEWQRKYAIAHKSVYTEVFKDLETFRKANGFDVLMRKDALDLTDLDPMQVKALLRSNAILCSDPAMDVTGQIIKLLDETYAKKK